MAAGRDLNNEDELYFRGSPSAMVSARAGSTDRRSQWTGIVQPDRGAGAGKRAGGCGLLWPCSRARTIASRRCRCWPAPRKRFWRHGVKQAHPLPQP